MSEKIKKFISPKSLEMDSVVIAKAIYPNGKRSKGLPTKTVSFVLTKSGAEQLSRNLAMVTTNPDLREDGIIRVTGYFSNNNICTNIVDYIVK